MLYVNLKALAIESQSHFPAADLSTLSCIEVDTSQQIKTRTKNNISLSFCPSLNYLRVLGGKNNSRKWGFFSEKEFLINTLTHTLWLYQKSSEYFVENNLTQCDRLNLKALCLKLFQCQMMTQFFENPANSHYGEHLMQELKKSGYLLIHNNDTNHAFYLEIKLNLQQSREGDQVLCDIIFYNGGKGLGFHTRPESIGPLDSLLSFHNNRKRYTKMVFSCLEVNVARLLFLTANIDKAKRSYFLPRFPIHLMYMAVKSWSTATPSLMNTQRMQSKQRYQTCQIKSLKVVARHHLSESCFLHWKKSLMVNSINHSTPVHSFYSKTYDKAIICLEEKIKKTQAKELLVVRGSVDIGL